MIKFIFILGGARSGKSRYAVDRAKKMKKKTAFIATAVFSRGEMKKRIALHKKSRPRHWKVIEEGKEVSLTLSRLEGIYGVVLIDCLGLWVSNLLMENLSDKEIEKRIKRIIKTIQSVNRTTILVSNDVGSGIVPENALARRFRDVLGFSNQMMTKNADEVIFMQAGIPMVIKGGK